MLHYVFVLLHNTLTVLRSVIASIIYHSRHFGAVIASYNYFSKLIDQLYCFYSLSLFCCYLSAFQHLQILRFIFFLAECAHNTGNTNITPIFCYTTSQLTPRGKNVAAGRWTLFWPEIYCTFMHLFAMLNSCWTSLLTLVWNVSNIFRLRNILLIGRVKVVILHGVLLS